MKQNWKAVAWAAMLAIAMTGCGTAAETETDAAALLQKAQETMATVESMAVEMRMEIGMAGAGDTTYETSTTAQIVSQQDPMRMRMDMTIQAGDDEATEQMQMYAEEVDGALMSYVYVGGEWYAQPIEAEALEQYNASDSVSLYLENILSFQSEGQEEIGGVETTKISGVVEGDAMREALEESGITESVEGLGITAEEVEAMYAELGDLPVSLWIDADGYVRKYETDMTEIMQRLMDHALGAAGAAAEIGITITKTIITMEWRDFNMTTEIEIPEEARNAQTLTE